MAPLDSPDRKTLNVIWQDVVGQSLTSLRDSAEPMSVGIGGLVWGSRLRTSGLDVGSGGWRCRRVDALLFLLQKLTS